MGRERWSAAGLAVLAIAYLLAGRRYPLDTLAAPGPGVVPLIAGVALLVVSVWLFVTIGRIGATRVSGRPSAVRAGLADPATTKPLALCAALALYTALLPRLGFVASSCALVLVASRLMGATGWWRPIVLALSVAGGAYLLFARWLGVPLP